MNAHEFYRDVAELAMLSKGEAADLTRAVLEVLAMRVSSRTGLTKTETMTGVGAVLLTLREAVDRKEFNDLHVAAPCGVHQAAPVA